jgi:hypothetical protein
MMAFTRVILIGAMILAGFAGSAARAGMLGAPAVAGSVVICQNGVAVEVAIDASGQPAGPERARICGDCAACMLGGMAAVIPASLPGLHVRGQAVHPDPGRALCPDSAIWLGALARGPPATT